MYSTIYIVWSNPIYKYIKYHIITKLPSVRLLHQLRCAALLESDKNGLLARSVEARSMAQQTYYIHRMKRQEQHKNGNVCVCIQTKKIFLAGAGVLLVVVVSSLLDASK